MEEDSSLPSKGMPGKSYEKSWNLDDMIKNMDKKLIKSVNKVSMATEINAFKTHGGTFKKLMTKK